VISEENIIEGLATQRFVLDVLDDHAVEPMEADKDE